MPLLAAYFMAHPPLAIPSVGKGRERDIPAVLEAYDAIARQIAALEPATLIFITPHSTVYADYFHLSPGKGATGDMSAFGAPGTRFDTLYDRELADAIALCAGKAGIAAGGEGERDARLDHGCMVAMWYINRRFKNYRAVRLSPSGMGVSRHYRMGMCVQEAVQMTGRDAVLVASGDLSHKLTADGPYGYAAEGALFDRAVTDAFGRADFLSLMNLSPALRECAAECGYSPAVMLAGCMDGRNTQARLLAYEGPFGVGYAMAAFTAGEPNAERRFLSGHQAAVLRESQAKRATEDPCRALARQSLEHAVLTGGKLPLPKGLPAEMTGRKAGVFVSLSIGGRLRGCIGTITPVTGSIAEEINENAVSAGLHDHRFEPVTPNELPLLVYKVDVLGPAEAIEGPEALDVKRYGVIVSSGSKRGLLLPNLEGVDTVAEQIAIARGKAGISERETVTLKRFEVIRHE